MKLIIPQAIENKIHAYVMSVNSEIAGMGKLRVEGDNFIVEDVMIYEQEVSGATADLSSKSVAKWMNDLVRDGGSPKDWKLWFHSHYDMSAFFSKTDTDTIDRQNEGDWMLSLVVNRKREREARLDMYRPFRITVEDLDIEIESADTFAVPADIALEVSQKVKRKAVSTYKYGMGFKAKEYGGYVAPKPYSPKRKRRMYDESVEDDGADEGYSLQETLAMVKSLEAQRRSVEVLQGKESEEYTELSTELADWYYQLADMEADEATAELIRGEARLIEDEIYTADIESAETEANARAFHI